MFKCFSERLWGKPCHYAHCEQAIDATSVVATLAVARFLRSLWATPRRYERSGITCPPRQSILSGGEVSYPPNRVPLRSPSLRMLRSLFDIARTCNTCDSLGIGIHRVSG